MVQRAKRNNEITPENETDLTGKCSWFKGLFMKDIKTGQKFRTSFMNRT